MCSIANEDCPVMKPLVDDFLAKCKWPTAANIDTIERECDSSRRERTPKRVRLSSNKRGQVLPHQLESVFGIVPVRLGELVSPESGFSWPESPTCGSFAWWTTEMPSFRPEKIVHIFW
jgi:hypothetical protein